MADDRRDETPPPDPSETSLKILCFACAERHDIQVILWAKDGIRPPEGATSILACPRWIERRPDVPCEMRLCDDCYTRIARAYSSDWLLALAGRRDRLCKISFPNPQSNGDT